MICSPRTVFFPFARIWALSLLAACGLASSASPAAADVPPAAIENGGPLGTSGAAYADTPRAVALSKALGLVLPEALPLITLNSPNNNELLAQDGPFVPGAAKPLRYGTSVPITVSPQAGIWLDAPDGGSLWALEIASPGAIGLRLRLAQVNLPEGAQVTVYAPETPSLAEGPYTGRGTLNTGTVWTPSTFGERCRVELYLPKGVARAVPFVIDDAHHLYRNVWEFVDPTLEVGTCHNDVTCSATYANTAKACAGIGSISGSDSLYCSGTMLNTLSSDQTPYWLTANHCLSTESAANSAEIFWLYQTPTCNGAAPALTSVPRSAVATLVSANSSTDHSLLLIRGAIPSGLFWAGWSTTRPTSGSTVAGIHHPDGSFKRITFGTYAGTGSFSGASSVRGNWTSGVTEGGSSGSGLFRASNQQLFGQLFGGPSFCGATAANLHDWYGDFTLTYANFSAVSSALAAGSDDAAPTNNSCTAARGLSTPAGTSTGRIVKSTAEDWYSLSIPAGATFTANLASITNAYGNVDLQLFTACAGSAIASSTGTGTTETASWTNAGASAATIFVRVFLASSVRNTYDLSWTSVTPPTGPANNLCSAATTIPAVGGTFAGTTTNATSDTSSTCGGTTNSPDVWYTFTAPSAGNLTLDTCGSAFDTVMSIFATCPPGGTQVVCNDDALAGIGPCGSTTNRTSYLQRTLTSGQSVRIRIGGYNGAAGNFTLRMVWAGSVTTPVNDECAGALNIASGTTAFDSTTATTTAFTESACPFNITRDLWFRYVPPCSGSVTIDTCGAIGFDTIVAVYSTCPSGNNTAAICNDDTTACVTGGGLRSSFAFIGTAGTPYLIRVGGYNNIAGAGTLNISCTPGAPVGCGLSDLVGGDGNPPSDGSVDGNDFTAFLNAFAAADALADLVGGDGNPPADGSVDGNDFTAFLNAFAAGC